MEVARVMASFSKDPSTKVGCVIVGADKEILATGFNGFPRGCDDSADLYDLRPRKHLRTVHAEANSVAASSRTGASLKGATAYVTAPCCSQCAALLIQAGIARVVVPYGGVLRPEWRDSLEEGRTMFGEAGVRVEMLEPEEDRNGLH